MPYARLPWKTLKNQIRIPKGDNAKKIEKLGEDIGSFDINFFYEDGQPAEFDLEKHGLKDEDGQKLLDFLKKAKDAKSKGDKEYSATPLPIKKQLAPMPENSHFYRDQHKQAEKSLVDLAQPKEEGVVVKGQEMEQNTFEKILGEWFNKISLAGKDPDHAGIYSGVSCTLDSTGTATTTIQSKSGGKPETIKHIFEKGGPRVVLADPPSDQSIMLTMEFGKSMNSVKIPLCDKAVALRMFEASVISGTKVEFNEATLKGLAGDERYEKLNALLLPENKKDLEEFRKQASKNHELGKTPILGSEVDRVAKGHSRPT